jgi:acyl carrier protein
MREIFDDDALEVTRATTARDVAAWNSLSNIELLVALQSAFGVRFRTGEIAGLKNVGELVDTVTTRVRQAGR